jgi:hypothetical protein
MALVQVEEQHSVGAGFPPQEQLLSSTLYV